MYEFSLKDFRGFHDVDFLKIKPITLLIGENSAGKTSFLAAIKIILDLVKGDKEISFNSDPFQLGTFEQIAHYRGGKAGRAKEFAFSIRSNVSFGGRNRTSYTGPMVLSVRFVNFESQSIVSELTISTGDESLKASTEGRDVLIEFISSKGQKFRIEKIGYFSRNSRSDISKYWPFILRELRYRLRRKIDGNNGPVISDEIEERISFLSELADTFSMHMNENIETTSAIRTKPLRTYTPASEKRDGEGSHVPFEIAKLYRSKNKDSWKKLKDSIDSFGLSSEMFKQIGVKSFGSTASDPFQIQFSTDGPKTNIVDLGYGNSQVLPILYNVATAPRRSRFLIQQPEVHLHPKAQAALGTYFIDACTRDRKEFILETHSDFIVDRVRQAVQKGIISSEDVSILFFERKRLENTITEIRLDENGSPIDPPVSYRNFFVDEQMRNLGVLDADNN